jgi:hypothetical protein
MHPLDYVLPFTEDWIMYYLRLGEGMAGTRSSKRNNVIGQDLPKAKLRVEPLLG